MVRHYNGEARAGRMLPFVIRSQGQLVGQMHLFGLSWGSLLSCAAGYWVAESAAGRGIAPTALAAAVDYAMGDLGLHRVEVNIRPDNAASLAVVRKLGFRDEGLRERYLHINGAWRDHRTFALTREDLGGQSLFGAFSHQQQPVTLATHRRTSPAGERKGPNVFPVQPSSLIFLVIIAIWAAYFIQHWVRRREHLATARSVDQFSESMRVLEHRSPLPAADLSAPQPRSYAVSPARPARPEILVKRAAQTPSEAPISASSRAREAAAVSSAPAPVPSSGRRTRGLTFLGSLATLLVTVGLVPFGVVPWPAVLAPIAAIAAVMVWMRRGAEAERAARRAAAGPRRAARPQPERRDQQAATRRAAERGSVARESASAPTAEVEAEAVDSDEEQPVSARESFYDIQAVERGTRSWRRRRPRQLPAPRRRPLRPSSTRTTSR